MKNLTYTAELIAFDGVKKTIEANVFLPKETANLKYSISPLYNLSQKDENDNHINVIFCHLISNENDILSGDESYPLFIDVDKLTKLGDDYDFNKKQCLLLIFHDEITSFNNNQIQFFNQKINTFNRNALIGNYAMQLNDDNNLFLRPKTIGNSIIK